MSNNGLHTPTESLQAEVDALRRRLDKKEQAIRAYKHDYISLLNEVTPGTGSRRCSFNLSEEDRIFLGSMDPKNENNMTRGLRFIIYQIKLDLEDLEVLQ